VDSQAERLELALMAVELARRQMALASKVIADFYEAERNEYMTTESIRRFKQKVFAIGLDFHRITSKVTAVRSIT